MLSSFFDKFHLFSSSSSSKFRVHVDCAKNILNCDKREANTWSHRYERVYMTWWDTLWYVYEIMRTLRDRWWNEIERNNALFFSFSFQVQVGNFRHTIAKVQLGGSELAIVVSIVVCCVLLLLCTVGKLCTHTLTHGWWMCDCCSDRCSRCEIDKRNLWVIVSMHLHHSSSVLGAQRPLCSPCCQHCVCAWVWVCVSVFYSVIPAWMCTGQV